MAPYRSRLQCQARSLALAHTADPANGVGMKIWQCLDVPQQNWYYTGDNRIALTVSPQGSAELTGRTRVRRSASPSTLPTPTPTPHQPLALAKIPPFFLSYLCPPFHNPLPQPQPQPLHARSALGPSGLVPPLTPGFCLDLTNGNKANGNRMQIWQCSTGNTNQVWTTAGASARRRGGRFDRA